MKITRCYTRQIYGHHSQFKRKNDPLYLCPSGLRRLWDFPAKTTRIWLIASDKPNRNAVKVQYSIDLWHLFDDRRGVMDENPICTSHYQDQLLQKLTNAGEFPIYLTLHYEV